MSFITTFAMIVVVLAALYLLALGAASLIVPDRAGRFLLGFAGSAAAHHLEMSLRLVAGAALVLHAPNMLFATAFQFFGWALLITTAGLLLVPWQWHRRFAQQVVPHATRFIAVIGVVSLSIGGFILFAVLRGTVG